MYQKKTSYGLFLTFLLFLCFLLFSGIYQSKIKTKDLYSQPYRGSASNENMGNTGSNLKEIPIVVDEKKGNQSGADYLLPPAIGENIIQLLNAKEH